MRTWIQIKKLYKGIKAARALANSLTDEEAIAILDRDLTFAHNARYKKLGHALNDYCLGVHTLDELKYEESDLISETIWKYFIGRINRKVDAYVRNYYP